VRPLEEFLSTETLGGILLLIAAVAALVWTNIPGDSYEEFWTTHIAIGVGSHALNLNWSTANDGLMAVPFSSSGWRSSAKCCAASLRTEAARLCRSRQPLAGWPPSALIYLSLNIGGAGEHGWGIPMATDIASPVGVLALLGTRVPVSLKVFLAGACYR
jgi:NhaA family Na+:H+ antiporter